MQGINLALKSKSENGYTNKEMLEILREDISGLRQEVKSINSILLEGSGKIAENRSHINYLWGVVSAIFVGIVSLALKVLFSG